MAKLNIPNRLHAGDSLTFTDSVSDYPASSGWLIRYVLVTAANKYQFDSTADGDDHAFSVLATQTAQWEPAGYKWAAYAVKGVERKTIGTGSIELLPDLTAGASDQRHHVEKVLDAIESTLEGKATTDQQSVAINGRSLARYSPADLLAWRDKYKAELAQLKRAERVANGLSAGNKIMVRF